MGIVGLYGRTAAKHPVGYRLIENYATLPSAPAAFDHTNDFDGFHMLGNGPDPTNTVTGHEQGVGDCAFVGTVNVDLVESVESGEPFTIPSTDTVVTDYLKYDHGQDQGANLSDLLAVWQRIGLWGSRVAGYAAVDPHNLDAVWAATNAFGCLYVGIAVPATAEEQFANGQPWDLTGSAGDSQIVGGHCVVIISRGPGGGELVTWGQRQRFTDRWWQTYGEEAHAVISESQVERKGNGFGLDLATLQRDLASL